MDIWDDYRLILALHRAKTVRGTAEALGVNHATISRRLNRIESTSTCPVFERVTGGYRVTPYGAEIVSAAERMEALTREATRRSLATLEGLSGSIRISIPEPIAHYLLSDVLHDFAAQYPNINLEVRTSLSLVDLDLSEADIVVRGSNAPPEHLVGRRLFPFALSLYAHRDYLMMTPSEQRCWYSFSYSMRPKEWVAASPFPEAPIAIRSDDLMWLMHAAKAGRAMINTACYMADQEPDLIRLSAADLVTGTDLWVLTHPDLREAPRIKALMSAMTTAMLEKRDLIQGHQPFSKMTQN